MDQSTIVLEPASDILPALEEKRLQEQIVAVESIKKETSGTHHEVNIHKFVPYLIAALQNDFTVEEACSYAGVARRTYYRKLKEDPEFAEKMARAKNFTKLLAKRKVTQILVHGSDREAGQMARWYLEKREPETYGRHPINIQNNRQPNYFLTNKEAYEELTERLDRINRHAENTDKVNQALPNSASKETINTVI